MKQLFLFLSLLAITASQQLFAQESLWEVYHADSVELPSFRRPDQTDIDAQGYKWGVTSDGLSFTKSKDGITETIPVNDTSVGLLGEVLTVDFDNNIWAWRKDKAGFVKFNRKNLLFMPYELPIDTYIDNFIVNNYGAVYVRTYRTETGYSFYDRYLHIYNIEEDLWGKYNDYFVYKPVLNNNGELYEGFSFRKTIVQTTGEHYTYTQIEDLEYYDFELPTLCTNNGTEWYACVGWLMKSENGKWMRYDYPIQNYITKSGLAKIKLDLDGNIWIFLEKKIILKFTPKTSPLTTGQTYFDANQNGIKDPSESYLPNQKIKVLPSGKQFLTNQQGQFAFTGDSGATFVIEHVLESGVNISSDSLRYTITLSDTNITGLDFGLYGSAFKAKLSGSFSLPRFRCSTGQAGFLMFENGSEPLTDVSLKLQLPSGVEFIDADSLPDNQGGEIVWDLGDLAPFQTGKVKVLVKAPNFQQMGNSFAFKTSGMGYVGNTPIPFKKTNYYTLRCSYDPNDKQVSPEGVMDEGYTLKDVEEFDYLIRFQNTGNDTAYVVRLEDSLSTHLDWNSFEVVDASHTYTTEIDENGLVTFTFDQIMLPDSTTNEPASNGYIRYQISPKAGLPDNTVIKNTAFIYFDYNPAVITNTTINTLVDELPKVTATETSVETIGGFVFPNPTANEINISSPESGTIRLYSPTGNLRLKRNVEEGITKISLPELNKGLYLLELETAQGKQVSKLIIE